jgi:hypothetical protein
MRLLLLLLIAAAVAYFTVPTREAHEAAARAFLQDHQPVPTTGSALSVEQLVGYAKGLLAGQGRYESYYLLSRYSVDMPGAAYLECYGAYTLVRCSEVAPGG